MEYKAGNRVKIKSLDWYNENKDKTGRIRFKYENFIPEMSQYCGEILTIKQVEEEFECYLVSECGFALTDEMIEGLAEEETKPNIIEEAKTYWDSIKDAWICPEGYIFKDENGNLINTTKIVLEKKKKEYPKTYEECSLINGAEDRIPLRIIGMFTQLINARNAYWRIAGKEMGLGKPWKPTKDKMVYSIYRHSNKIETDMFSGESVTFEFPTKEMRDAFYENFKKEIEICKELL